MLATRVDSGLSKIREGSKSAGHRADLVLRKQVVSEFHGRRGRKGSRVRASSHRPEMFCGCRAYTVGGPVRRTGRRADGAVRGHRPGGRWGKIPTPRKYFHRKVMSTGQRAPLPAPVRPRSRGHPKTTTGGHRPPPTPGGATPGGALTAAADRRGRSPARRAGGPAAPGPRRRARSGTAAVVAPAPGAGPRRPGPAARARPVPAGAEMILACAFGCMGYGVLRGRRRRCRTSP